MVCGVRVCFCIGVPVCVAKESLATKRRSHTPTLRLTILGCCLYCASRHDTQEKARALKVAAEAVTDRFERGEGGAFCRMLCTSVLEAAVGTEACATSPASRAASWEAFHTTRACVGRHRLAEHGCIALGLHEHRARCRARASEQMPPARRRVIDAQGPTRALRNQFARVLGDSRRRRKWLCIVPEALGEEAAQRQRRFRGHLWRAERDLELVAEPGTLQSSGGQSQTGVRQGLEPTQSRGTRTSCRWPPFQCSA